MFGGNILEVKMVICSVHSLIMRRKIQHSKVRYLLVDKSYKRDVIKTQPNSELKAYFIVRSNVMHPPGLNDCQDQEVEKSVRKQWFDQIKRDYPNTTWAKSLKFCGKIADATADSLDYYYFTL